MMFLVLDCGSLNTLIATSTTEAGEKKADY